MTQQAHPSPSVTVRHAEPHEYDAVGEQTQRAFAAGPYGHLPSSPERRRLELDAGARARSGALLVAVAADGELLGSATLVRPGTPEARLALPDEAELRLLVVEPGRQGSGTGALLVAASLAEARRWGATAVVLDTGALNVGAQRLYQRAGFERITDREPEPYPGFDSPPHVYRFALGGSRSGTDAGAGR